MSNVVDLLPLSIQARVRNCVERTRQGAADFLEFRSALGRKRVARAVRNVKDAADAVEAARDLLALEAAIGTMGVKSVELVSLFEDHPDPVARLASVMRRAAAHVLGDDGELFEQWAGNLERGTAATSTT